jgi:hypothetical protein
MIIILIIDNLFIFYKDYANKHAYEDQYMRQLISEVPTCNPSLLSPSQCSSMDSTTNTTLLSVNLTAVPTSIPSENASQLPSELPTCHPSLTNESSNGTIGVCVKNGNNNTANIIRVPNKKGYLIVKYL